MMSELHLMQIVYKSKATVISKRLSLLVRKKLLYNKNSYLQSYLSQGLNINSLGLLGRASRGKMMHLREVQASYEALSPADWAALCF